jgi:hypothetical protein
MQTLELPPYTLTRTPDGIVAAHPALSTPIPVPEALLLRVVKQAAREALECHGKMQPSVRLFKER